ncbi:hypothetical protein Q73_09990 [Bacillus coahuilensis m2-6]|uniref:SH3 domain-containing protein n=1 Tax=Bacillus coahuilensis TaxID=408580 RepID=UPI000185115B|nr:SH3 domain-containing protein [Bacillus coahuilensis]KUP07296.1 hypothetical protein Q73_09990 [Bacillus coahuilensis m2-6]
MNPKLGLFLLLLFLFSFIPIIVLAKTNSLQQNEKLSIRSGPGLSYPVLATTLPPSVMILEQEGDWLKIQLDEQIGWIPSWQYAIESTVNTIGKVTGDRLNVRESPSIEAPIVGLLRRDEEVIIFSSSTEEWTKIQSSSFSGYVSSQFVTALDSGSHLLKAAQVNQHSANLYSGPTEDSQLIKTLLPEEPLSILHEWNDWLLVMNDRYEGWMKRGTLSIISPEVPSFTHTMDQKVSISAPTLSVRSSPNFSSEKLGEVAYGEEFSLLDSSSSWYKIQYKGETGWIPSWFSFVGYGSINPTDSFSSIFLLYDNTNIREEPSTQATTIKNGKAGEEYTVIEPSGEWYKIQLDEDQVGYVASWVVFSPSTMMDDRQSLEEFAGRPLILIDAGHGGEDSGAIGANESLEKDLTLKTSRILAEKLTELQFNVVFTRENDQYIPLSTRTLFSNYYQADAFLSLHFDSIADESITGFTTYYYHENQKDLADTINKGLASSISLRNRGTKKEDYFVLRENTQPSVLLELGYISNSKEERTIHTDEYLDRATDGIVSGIEEYFSSH